MCVINMRMKEKVLKILEQSRGNFISGENIAEKLGITRATVCNAVKFLRSEGHRIISSTKIGYCLEKQSDALTEGGIILNLRETSLIKKVICLDKIDSTNNYAKKLALEGAVEGTLIVANEQTAGRGRRGHSFMSPPGSGLYMTLILRPNVETPEFQMITIAAAVSVCLAIEELSPATKPKIKWVNDIFLRGKKICGILTEAITSFESGEIESVITGIGINISTKKFDEEISQTAGAIFDNKSDEKEFTRDELAARIADYIMEFSKKLDSHELIEAYKKRSMLIGEDINYMKNDVKNRAHVIGIDDTGGLEIINEEGKKEVLRSGEVFTIRAIN